MNSRASRAAGARIDRMRGDCQQWVIERLYRRAEKCIFTVPLEKVGWLPAGRSQVGIRPDRGEYSRAAWSGVTRRAHWSSREP